MTLKDLLQRSSLKAIGLRLGLDVRMVDGHLHIWLATGGLNEVQVNKFLPLRHYRVILFPDTDPKGCAFKTWYNAAQEVMHSFFWPRHNPIRVSSFLELNATPDQKQRKIDLVDYYFEGRANS